MLLSMQAVQFVYLQDHPEFLPIIAAWHHEEWAYIRPGDTIAARQKRLAAECGHCEIPTSLVALIDGSVAGSISLLAEDMDTHPELTPWLASLYVAPQRRRQGIGAALVKRLTEEARNVGVSKLYLYTPSEERFYARLGWRTLEQTSYAGKPATVMCYDLAS